MNDVIDFVIGQGSEIFENISYNVILAFIFCRILSLDDFNEALVCRIKRFQGFIGGFVHISSFDFPARFRSLCWTTLFWLPVSRAFPPICKLLVIGVSDCIWTAFKTKE